MTSRVNGDDLEVFEKLIKEFSEDWPDLVPIVVGEYEADHGIGIRARSSAAKSILGYISYMSSNPKIDRLCALLIALLEVLEDDLEGISSAHEHWTSRPDNEGSPVSHGSRRR